MMKRRDSLKCGVLAGGAAAGNLDPLGKGIVGMKTLGQGEMRNRVDEVLQYTLSQSQLDCFAIGADKVTELQDLIKRIPEASVRT